MLIVVILRVGTWLFVLVVLVILLLPFVAGAFPETQRLAEEAVRYQCDPTDVVGSRTDPRTAWTFPEIIAAAEA